MDTDTTAAPSELMTVGPAFAAPVGHGLSLFADKDSFALGQRMALMLANSSIIPDTYRQQYLKDSAWVDNPDAVGNCFIALELAQRLNTSPLIVMQQVDMIHGRPSLRGTFLIALINGSRVFTELEFECNHAAGDAYGYRARATNRATGKECVGPWITWAMVKGEKWDAKTGSKWKTMPELMFQYRAAAFWSRLFAPHITMGLYESEEAVETFGEEPAGKVNRMALLNARSAEPTPDAEKPAADPEAGTKPKRARASRAATLNGASAETERSETEPTGPSEPATATADDFIEGEAIEPDAEPTTDLNPEPASAEAAHPDPAEAALPAEPARPTRQRHSPLDVTEPAAQTTAKRAVPSSFNLE